MNKGMKYTIALTLMVGSLIATAGFASARGMGNGGCPGMMNGSGSGYAAMTPEQQTAFQTMHDEHLKVVTPMQAKMQQLQADMYAEQVKETPDTKKIMQIAEEQGKLRGQMQVARVELNKKMTAQGLPGAGMHRGMVMDHGRRNYDGMKGGGFHGGGHGGKRGGCY